MNRYRFICDGGYAWEGLDWKTCYGVVDGHKHSSGVSLYLFDAAGKAVSLSEGMKSWFFRYREIEEMKEEQLEFDFGV